MVSEKTLKKAQIKQQISDLYKRDKGLNIEIETLIQQKHNIDLNFEERRLSLLQQFNRDYVPQAKHTVDKNIMHYVRSCVLACLRKAMRGKCNTEDIEFNFQIEENGTLKLDCIIPDVNE